MDAESFKCQYLPFHPKLYRIAFALLENKADAEDVLQETYYKLWNRKEELINIRNPEAFAVTLIKNLCLDFLRSPQGRRKEEEVNGSIPTTGSSPDAELEQKDEIRRVQQLINRLPKNQRQIVRLRGIDDCSFEEIEQITGLSAANIRTLLSRARKFIREQFEK